MTLWRLAARSAADDERDAALSRAAGIPAVMAPLLRRRGVRTAAEASAYLRPAEGVLHDVGLLEGAEAAADLLVATARRGGRIVVFGDYDVDGVTAVAQLRAALRRIGADAVAFIPHRLRDGYGLRPDTVRRVVAELAPSAIVTVDCGITAREGVACARAAGVDVVVTDHHLVPKELPDGAIVVNPRQPGCRYPEKDLAAAGIALKLAEAIGRRAGTPLSVVSLLRAAALGTIADMVPLAGENRVIAARGLAALGGSRAPGLRALLAESGVPAGAAPTAEEVSFRIAPRLNAAGRLDTALLALSLFEERDASRAFEIARDLSERNGERRALERRVVAEARARVEARDGGVGSLIVEADAGWHRGVLGIAASRLAREYHRPVLLFGIEGDRASGSGRSIPGLSLHGLLDTLAHRFTDFGGHEQAVGGSLPASSFEAFRDDARELFAESVPAEILERVAEVDAPLELEQIDSDLVDALSRLEPHGSGNPRPVFLARGVRTASPFAPLGAGGHGISGRLRAPRGPFRAVAWQPSETVARLTESGASMDLLYRVEPPRHGYASSIEILDARPAENAA
ncbi:MAG TPA: single-stranded-DNA-specific exonuclease RecJ [Thermoanaerobaculia bacterium]|jgi:single-stranded-DNA-specific exonuclease|nr:single-stranded-DNA-specific exonuclease RecJ [Thermoanaerobaculia bacterium]